MKKWLIFAVIAAMFAMVMFTACPGGDSGGEVSDAQILGMNVDGVYTPIRFGLDDTASATVNIDVFSTIGTALLDKDGKAVVPAATITACTVTVTPVDQYFVVGFEASKGYTYNAFTILTSDTKNAESVTPSSTGAVGQNMIGYKVNEQTGVIEKYANDSDDQWFALIEDTGGKLYRYDIKQTVGTGASAVVHPLVVYRDFEEVSAANFDPSDSSGTKGGWWITTSTAATYQDDEFEPGKFLSIGVASFNPGGYPLENGRMSWSEFVKIPAKGVTK
jgi:hypothetical protein